VPELEHETPVPEVADGGYLGVVEVVAVGERRDAGDVLGRDVGVEGGEDGRRPFGVRQRRETGQVGGRQLG